MDILTSSSNRRIHESNLELFKARLAGKLCIALVSAAQIIPSFIIAFTPPVLQGIPELLILIAVPILTLMILLITIEYIFYKRMGPKIAKYSDLADIALLLLYMAYWAVTLTASLMKINHKDPPAFEVTAIYGFTNFSWKTLLTTLIVQKWQLKIIPPVAASIYAAVFTTFYAPSYLILNMTRAVFQLFSIIFIIYCEDKIKWSMVWKNLQREKWMQVNKFILNNIPENIMILDFAAGRVKFISDYCKLLMKKGKCSGSPSEFFNSIRDLRQQYDDEEQSEFNDRRPLIERLTTQNEFLGGDADDKYMKIEALEWLITNFKEIIQEKNLQERHFLIYNGKLRMENDVPDKSIEVKISFIKHVESEYIILILRDTTQRDLLVTLEETNKYKDQLLASVSHELRAPLNGTINLVESAVNSPKTPENLKETLLTPALRSSKFLLHIINDMIDMRQIKENKLRLVFQSGDLKETLKNAAQLIELQAKKKGVRLILELDSKLPVSFCTDHTRLSQIVLNLLSNAMKFTKEGAIKLRATSMAEGRLVKISVEDSGVGIRKEKFCKLFSSQTTIELEEQHVVDPTRVGLGLNIASNLADLLAPKSHPGINASSVFNQGSTFSFIIENKQMATAEERAQDLNKGDLSSNEIAEELPGIIDPELRQEVQRNESPGVFMPSTRTLEFDAFKKSSCICSKVLIVDDNPFNTMAFETILNSLDIRCDSVYSGSACLKRLLERQNKTCGKNCQPYSVVFMDQEMPEMTGCETVMEIRRLQSENLIPDLKIIGCTAHKANEEVEKFVESGLDQCIYKPISVMMIKDVLKEIF